MSFSFGTPSSAPAGGLSGGFSFGANKPATPGFGLGATTQASTSLFGATQTSAAPAFGTTPTFGSNTSAAPAFGSTATPAFGSTATPAFGSTTTPAFGSTTAPAFGSTAAPAFGATTSAPSFGTTAPAFGAGNTSFGTGLGTGGLNFGTGTAATTAATGLSFGATAPKPGLSGFGFGSTTTTQSGLGLFGTTTTSTTTSAGLFGAKIGTGLNLTAPSSSAAPSLGLGGIAPTTSSTVTGDGKSEPPKQTKLPNEIATTVDSFKEFVKKQKSMSSEVMRVTAKPLHKVSRCCSELSRVVVSLSGEVSRCRSQSRRLRALGADALIAAERHADSTGLELDGSAPPAYIKMLIAELEQQLITFRRQMDVADKQMQASPRLLTEQELNLGIRRMHESLIALAGRLQNVHSQVEAQKEQYLNLRKYILKDPTNVFEKQTTLSAFDEILRYSDSVSKRSKRASYGDVSNTSAVLADPAAALGSVHRLAGPTPFSYIGSSLTPYNLGDASNTSWQPTPQPATTTSLNTTGLTFGGSDNSSFQLQKPPGKRGKQ